MAFNRDASRLQPREIARRSFKSTAIAAAGQSLSVIHTKPVATAPCVRLGRHFQIVRRTTAALLGASGVLLALIFVLASNVTGGAVLAQTQAIQPLSANDVSWLFPAPKKAEDFASLISMQDLTVPNLQDPTKRDPVWSHAAFQQFLSIAGSPAAQVAGTPSRIGLPGEAQSIEAWHIAGVRIDAGAPGLSTDIIGQFGQRPQIRLIIQPVTRNADGTPNVHDIAGHLIFDFTTELQAGAQPTCSPRPVPDLVAFKAIVAELADLRTKLSEGKLGTNSVTTSGVPLGVHPGLMDPSTAAGVRKEMKAFLERHLSAQRLSAMAIMGLPAGQTSPWIFLSMVNLPPGIVPALPNGGFVPVHGPTLDGQQFAELLNPVGAKSRVVPLPHPNNLNPITCANAALPNPAPPVAQRHGSSTADVFISSPPQPDAIRKILDLIADPNRSHFFNTDCISCHTETRQSMELLHVTNIPGIDTAVLPNGSWNVRNFGWSPPIEGPVQGTVTRRTANETAAVVNFVNAQFLGK
jgi:hypothetical protein